jgi:1,4-alpha-glucan branching enzyme
MLYLDYSRPSGAWVPNRFGGRENLEAIEFLRRTNTEVYGRFPTAMTIAEESTAWPQVSRPVDGGGLGFGYKWNMGWMHDTLNYFGMDPIHRRYHHGSINFGLHYTFSENFVLPVSHDEVVHGKRSILGRMPGNEWERFANLRAYYGFMFAHPGKKLLFMGCEFAQEREWNHDRGLDWHLLERPHHAGVQRLLRDLNRCYRELAALHELDCENAGFEWIVADDADHSVFAWMRKGRSPRARCIAIMNFTPEVRTGYRVKTPYGGYWREILNTDAAVYGGSTAGNTGGMVASKLGGQFELILTLPPFSTLFFIPEP